MKPYLEQLVARLLSVRERRVAVRSRCPSTERQRLRKVRPSDLAWQGPARCSALGPIPDECGVRRQVSE